MTSRLESDRFPYLNLRVDVRGRTYAIDALIDTGFDGFLADPPGPPSMRCRLGIINHGGEAASYARRSALAPGPLGGVADALARVAAG